MIHAIDAAGNQMRFLDLTDLPVPLQEGLLDSLRLEMEALPVERWDRPWGRGALDPSFVNWYRVLVERGSALLDGFGLRPKYKIVTGHTTLVQDPGHDETVMLFVKPARTP